MQLNDIFINQNILPRNLLPGIGIFPPYPGKGQLLHEIPVNRPGQVEEAAPLFEQERSFQVRSRPGILA